MVPAIHLDNALPMERSVWSVAKSTTLLRSAELEEIELYDLEQEPNQHHEEDHIEMVNKNSIFQ